MRSRVRSGHAAWLRAALLVLALVLVPACVRVPDSGPVQAGPEIGSDDEPALRYLPIGPQPGDDQLGVVSGYLDAMRAFPPDPGIVREFLTDEAKASWSPGAGTRIYSERPEVERVGDSSVRVDATQRSRLTDRGAWVELSGDEQRLQRVLRLERQRGEWRIANPLAGLLIPDFDFERYYRQYSLYFFDPARRVLVPDPVYLPQGDQTATLLVRGLVRGPTDWLRGAVRSLVPPTDRASVSVPVGDDGVAQVQLASAARGLAAADREALAAQLSWTLRQVTDVDTVRVTVGGGAPLALDDGSNVTDVDGWADYDPADTAAAQTLYALRGDQVVTVDPFGARASRVPGRFGAGADPVSAFAVERSGKVVAVVTGDGTTVEVGPLAGQSSRVWFDRGTALVGVQWDLHGLLWAVDSTRGGPAVYVLREQRGRKVALGPDAPEDISAFALSRDGVRMAVISGSGRDARLLVGRVVRPGDGSLAVTVDRWREVGTGTASLRRFVDVAWAGPTELTVVAEENRGEPQTFTVSTDGSAVAPSNLLDLDIVSVADTPAADRPAVVATRPGSLYVQLADRWSELALRGALREPSYVE